MLEQHIDRLHRRIFLLLNKYFYDRKVASYELMLRIEREIAQKHREERRRKKNEMKIRSMVRVASEGIIFQNSSLQIRMNCL